jgi:transcriptional regulator with XRE-family HTH domain
MGIARQSPPSSELKTFSDRLKKAIAFKKKDTAVLAKESGYKPDDINKLLQGMREPSMKKLVLLANSLGCSIDYLLGLTPEAKRASVMVQADTDAIKGRTSDRGQTSGQISGNAELFLAIVPELLESDVELILYLASFLIDRKEKRLTQLVKEITSEDKKEVEKKKSLQAFIGKLSGGSDDSGYAEDDLLENDDDDFEDEDFDEDESYEDDDFDFDDE